MKHLTIILDPIRVKGSTEDMETLRADLYEKIQSMIEDETLEFSVDEEEENEDEDF